MRIAPNQGEHTEWEGPVAVKRKVQPGFLLHPIQRKHDKHNAQPPPSVENTNCPHLRCIISAFSKHSA